MVTGPDSLRSFLEQQLTTFGKEEPDFMSELLSQCGLDGVPRVVDASLPYFLAPNTDGSREAAERIAADASLLEYVVFFTGRLCMVEEEKGTVAPRFYPDLDPNVARLLFFQNRYRLARVEEIGVSDAFSEGAQDGPTAWRGPEETWFQSDSEDESNETLEEFESTLITRYIGVGVRHFHCIVRIARDRLAFVDGKGGMYQMLFRDIVGVQPQTGFLASTVTVRGTTETWDIGVEGGKARRREVAARMAQAISSLS